MASGPAGKSALGQRGEQESCHQCTELRTSPGLPNLAKAWSRPGQNTAMKNEELSAICSVGIRVSLPPHEIIQISSSARKFWIS